MKDTGKASVVVFLFLQVVWITVSGQQVLPGDFTALEKFLKANVVKLTMLNTLDLSHNKFSGSNSFTGNISTQPTDSCSKLETLDLSFNKLDGNLPAEIFQSSSNLKALYLQMNNFNGNLSVGAGQGQSIVEINLESNSFSALIPQALLQFPNLTILKLGKNNFSGSLNSSTGFPASLLELDLHSKSLSGPLPLLGQGLQVLDLHNNRFSEGLPPSLTQLQSLCYLDLSLNDFTGDFPSNLNVLSNLSRISLADNSFSSYSLPALGGLSKLEVLDLSGTNLTGTIPSSIGELNESLATLKLSRNSLGGDIPVEISTLKKLVLLDLSFNMLNGNISIPHSDGDLNERFTFLNLSWNRLGGEIPSLMDTLKKLVTLDLSHNKLEGEIPPNMVDLTLLSAVDLSNNNLSAGSRFSSHCDSGINLEEKISGLSQLNRVEPTACGVEDVASDYTKVVEPTLGPIQLEDLPGYTRSVYERDYALFTPESQVYTPVTVQQPLCVPDHTSHVFTFLDVSRKNDGNLVGSSAFFQGG
ncbi:hypothetical protein R1flu_025778 [Riccia fluitans]|uniref:Uncharacterized protein n=1 Tax=Riccia fluitans TaxID=41844 RepID=A0ABD1Y1P6_9MARC